MPTSFLTSTDITTLTGALANHFQTFTLDRSRTIIVNKEPRRVISSVHSTNFPGYGNIGNPTNITSYVPVSGIYPAMINFVRTQGSEELLELHANIPKNAVVRIKVEKDCADYIDKDKTENVDIYGKKYNVITERETKSFLGLDYYVYYLGETS